MEIKDFKKNYLICDALWALLVMKLNKYWHFDCVFALEIGKCLCKLEILLLL